MQVAPASFVIGIVNCAKLSMYASFLERKGYACTQTADADCSVLVACADHLADQPIAAWGRRLGGPKIVLGANPPSDWRAATRLELPLLPVHLEKRILELQEGDSGQTGKGRLYDVVLVDDDPTIRAATVSAFEQCGLTVRGCSGFGELTGALLNHRPDFVILDLNLPGLSGESVGNMIKGRAIPMAVFSSAPQEQIDEARKTIGGVQGFSKTTSLVAMGRWIRSYLDRAAQ